MMLTSQRWFSQDDYNYADCLKCRTFIVRMPQCPLFFLNTDLTLDSRKLNINIHHLSKNFIRHFHATIVLSSSHIAFWSALLVHLIYSEIFILLTYISAPVANMCL